MRNSNLIVSTAVAVSAIFGIGAASAADMAPAPRAYSKAPMVAPVMIYNWTGCYAGGYVGGATHDRNWQTTDLGSVGQGGTFAVYDASATNPWSYGQGSSVIGGGTIGCNWQGAASPFVVGVEAEGGYLGLRGSAYQPSPFQEVLGSARTNSGYAFVGGRVGWAVDRVLFYAKGGGAFYESQASADDSSSTNPGRSDTVHAVGTKDQFVFAVGGGVEYAMMNNWRIKAEYLYLGRGKSFNSCGIDANVAQDFCWRQDPSAIHTFKIGLNWAWGGPAVVAKY